MFGVDRLSKDNMSLSIVEGNPNRSISGVSDKDDFFVHTQKEYCSDFGYETGYCYYLYLK